MLSEEVHLLFSACLLLVHLDALFFRSCKRQSVIIPSSGYCPAPDDFVINYFISFVIFLLGKSPCPFSSCSQKDIMGLCWLLLPFSALVIFSTVTLEDGRF